MVHAQENAMDEQEEPGGGLFVIMLALGFLGLFGFLAIMGGAL